MFFQWFKNNSEKVDVTAYTDDDMIGLTEVAQSDPKIGRGSTLLKDETLNIFYEEVIVKWDVATRIEKDVFDSHPCCVQRMKNRHRLLFLGNL